MQFCTFDNQWKEGSTTSYMIHGVYKKNESVAELQCSKLVIRRKFSNQPAKNDTASIEEKK